MIENLIERLQYLCNTIPNLLTEIDELTFNEKTSP